MKQQIGNLLHAFGQITAHPIIKTIAAGTGVVISYVLPDQGLRDMGIATAILITIDTLTGIVASVKSGNAISSTKLRRIVTKTIGYLSLVTVASVAGRWMPGLGGNPSPVLSPVFLVLIATEGLSIIENLVKSGVYVPPSLRAVLESGKKEEETKNAGE